MEGRCVDPSDIGKHSKMIKTAQKDMTQSDILVCGKCHCVFYFIDLFKEHKDNGCNKESYLKDCCDTKPKLWAFLLWKSSQLNNNNSSNDINSWYKQWIKMDESKREFWEAAGNTILLDQGSLQEMPVKITKTVLDNNPSKSAGLPKSTSKNKFTPPTRQKNTTPEQNKQLPTTTEQLIIIRKDESYNSPLNKTTEQPKVVRKTADTPRNIYRRANRTIPNTNGQEIEEQTVDKIIARRFNPRIKMHQFLVQWKGLPHDQNTWEARTHLETCPELLKTFEKQLEFQIKKRAKQAEAPTTTPILQPQQQNIVNSNVLSPINHKKMITKTTPTTRIVKPQRTVENVIEKEFNTHTKLFEWVKYMGNIL